MLEVKNDMEKLSHERELKNASTNLVLPINELTNTRKENEKNGHAKGIYN